MTRAVVHLVPELRRELKQSIRMHPGKSGGTYEKPLDAICGVSCGDLMVRFMFAWSCQCRLRLLELVITQAYISITSSVGIAAPGQFSELQKLLSFSGPNSCFDMGSSRFT
jgi:hypothetical protein